MYQQNAPNAVSFTTSSNQLTASTPKIRSIEDIMAEIGAELTDVHNSASNIADKLSGPEPEGKGDACPAPSSLHSRLDAILGGLRNTNYHLNRSHRALNG